MYDVKIAGGQVLHRGRFRPLDIGINEEKIAKVGRELGQAQRTVDAGNLLILPGVIDGHVHLRDFGEAEKEDFRSGTRAAAAGGVTTVVDMPNNNPPIDSPDRIRDKIQLGREKSLVNFALYGAIPEKLDQVGPMLEEGIIGFKWFMEEKEVNLQRLAKELEQRSALLTVHAEDPRFLKEVSEARTPADYWDRRPPKAELEAVRRLLKADLSRLHLAHVSLPETLDLAGSRVTSEITPQHLLLSKDDISLRDFKYICNPPLRNVDTVKGLQKALTEGKIDLIASDHAPHRSPEKLTEDPAQAEAGVPGLETMVPLVFTFADDNDIQLELVAGMLTSSPADIFGIPKRGKIEVGYHADLTVIDPGLERTIRGKDFYSKAEYTPFEGQKVRFWPVLTVINGEIIYEQGEILASTRAQFLGGR